MDTLITLSKSDLMVYRHSPLHLWAKKHGAYQSQPSLFGSMYSQVASLAREYVATWIQPNLPSSQIEYGFPCQHPRLKATLDALMVEAESGQAYGFVFKMSNKINQDHLVEAAFLSMAYKQTHDLKRLFIVLLNKYYTRGDDLDLLHLFQVVEVTAEAEGLVKDVANQVNAAHQVLTLDSPEGLVGCESPDTCPCKHLCHPDLPEYSIYDLAYINSRTRRELLAQGVKMIDQVPMEHQTNKRIQLQVQLTKEKSSYYDKQGITNEFDALEYPLYFLDYEACNLPIPAHPGHWPYFELVFQFSLHRLDKSGELAHFEFLHLDKSDPSRTLIDTLAAHVGTKGSLITWNKSYEARMHNQLARLAPDKLLFLLGLNQRLYDLRDVFTRGYYLDYRFKGKTSLKNVLPVISADLDYKKLTIGKGDEASRVWYELVYLEKDVAKREEIAQNLKDYCRVDTLGMVHVYQYLKGLK